MVYRFLSLVCALVCASAFAQNNRSAVSVLGSDLNTCSVPSPCRSFAKAITMTNSGGEIIAVDSGGYGTFSIDRAVTVRPVPGAYAGITVTSGDGIAVSAPGVYDDVILRGITINGLGGDTGIRYYAAHSLTIENCAIDRMANTGIVTVSSDNLFVSDTTVTNCAFGGIQVGNGPETIYATIVNSRFVGNADGIAVYQGGNVTIANTTLSRNNAGVLLMAATVATNANAVIESSTISGNVTGINSSAIDGTASVRVSNCTITNNATGLHTNGAGAQILSRSNNTLQVNGTNGTFSGTFTAN